MLLSMDRECPGNRDSRVTVVGHWAVKSLGKLTKVQLGRAKQMLAPQVEHMEDGVDGSRQHVVRGVCWRWGMFFSSLHRCGVGSSQ